MPTFVDSNVVVTTGPAAETMLMLKRDTPTLSCSRERWEEAQRYERRTWLELHREMSDDRNEFHAAAMGGYEALRGCGARSLLEVGCGPFTNARLILPVLGGVESVRLADPLIVEYMSHPHCPYAQGGVLSGSRLSAKTLSECVDGYQYDVIVSINVAEHCDEFSLEWILDLCFPGGHVVVGERCYSDWRVAEHCRTHYDAGHPLRLCDSHWAKFAESVDIKHEARRDGEDGGFSSLRYLIGRKK